MAKDVAAFIGGHDLSPAAVIGHSLGGKVAMRLALMRADLVERLVVVDVAPVAYGHSFAPFVAAMRAVDLAAVQRRADADLQLERAIGDAAIRNFLLQNLVKTDAGFAWRVNLEALAANMPELLGFPRAADGRGVPRPRPVHRRRPVPVHRGRAPAADRAPVPARRACGDRGRRPLGPRRAPGRVPGAGAAVSELSGERMPSDRADRRLTSRARAGTRRRSSDQYGSFGERSSDRLARLRALRRSIASARWISAMA